MIIIRILYKILEVMDKLEDRLDKLEKQYEKMAITKNIQKRSRTMETKTTSKRRTNKQP